MCVGTANAEIMGAGAYPASESVALADWMDEIERYGIESIDTEAASSEYLFYHWDRESVGGLVLQSIPNFY
jgi:hypothetical protein